MNASMVSVLSFCGGGLLFLGCSLLEFGSSDRHCSRTAEAYFHNDLVFPLRWMFAFLIVLVLVHVCLLLVVGSGNPDGGRCYRFFVRMFGKECDVKQQVDCLEDELIPESPHERKNDFLKRAGSDYGYRSSSLGFIDQWRPLEIPALVHPLSFPTLEEKEVYLDYAGSALPHATQLEEILNIHKGQILANPHSWGGPASTRTFLAMEQVKKRLMDLWNGHPGNRYFGGGTSPVLFSASTQDLVEEIHPGYDIIFTSGTTQALKMVAECFPWQKGCPVCGSTFVYPLNIHTSVIGMRAMALDKGANFQCWTMSNIVNAIHSGRFASQVSKNADNGSLVANCQSQKTQSDSLPIVCQCSRETKATTTTTKMISNLLVLPAECNFAGDRVDVESLVSKLRAQNHVDSSSQSSKWWILVDLAKAACTSSLHLRKMDPDFACLSFYKIFGEPTGLGCLLVKRSVLSMLSQSNPNLGQQQNHALATYFGGGSVDVVLPRQNFVVPRGSKDRESLGLALTHGTIHFRGIVSLHAGLNVLERMGNLNAIESHTHCLFLELLARLKSLQHSNGAQAIQIYNVPRDFGCGPTVALNVRRSDGSYVGYQEVSKLAALNRPPIQFRTGCFCNPGGCQMALNISDEEVIRNFSRAGHVCGDDIDVIDGKPTGAIRLSLGKDSIWEDIDALIVFLEKTFVSQSMEVDRKDTWDCRPRKILISELYIYPIKSCRAQRVSKWKLQRETSRPEFDREFALVDSYGTAMRLQRYPNMAFISPEINLETKTMIVSAPEREPLTILLEDCPGYGEGIVKVCGNRCGGVLWGDRQVSQWFSDFLGIQCWLARHSSISTRYCIPETQSTEKIDSTFARNSFIAFANEQPLLLISEHAVDILNRVLASQGQTKVTPRHFRPNIVVRFAGLNALANECDSKVHEEDGWARIRATNKLLELEVVGPCPRCSMVDVDPSSGSKGYALRALADYRRSNGQISFGIFLKSCTTQDLPRPKTIFSNDSGNNLEPELWLEVGDVLLCE